MTKEGYKMTNDEVIDKILFMKHMLSDNEELFQALDLAEDAIKRQISKTTERVYTKDFEIETLCPVCRKEMVIHDKYTYCQKCGQKLEDFAGTQIDDKFIAHWIEYLEGEES